MSSVLLDTNCYSLVASGDRKIYSHLRQADVIYFSTVVLGELFAGFEGGNRKYGNINTLENFLAEDNVRRIDVSYKTAQIYGSLLYRLRKKGTPLPTNDIWIAAHTIETSSTLITYDSHFLKIEGLQVWEVLAE